MSLYSPDSTESTSTNKDPVYFAAKPAAETAGILMDRGSSFFDMLRTNSYLDKLNKMWRFYHGAYSGDVGYGHEVNFTGDQGELVNIPINHFRNIGQHILNIITSTRPVMESRAINTDYKSLAQTYLANGILDYYMREKKLEECLKKAVELSIVLGAGYVKMEWNATAGDTYEVDEETGEQINEGEAEFSNLTPLDVIFDGTKETWDNDWIMVRTFKNRFNLMAKYPEFAQQLSSLATKSNNAITKLAIWSNDDTDDIPVYEFYHKRTEAMPDGRYMLFADSDIVLMDMKMPYREIPVFRIVPSEILGTPYGYSPLFDIYPIQEGINSLYSTIMTNQNAFGVQNVWIKRGSDINFNSIEGAMNIIESEQKPEALNLTATPPEIFKFLDELIKASETISGINSVTRGNPEASLKSGTALALVQSQSLQFVSGLQQSYVNLIENTGTSLINILKDFATAPKVIALVGKNNRTFLKEFTGDQVKDINRVVVDMGNPLSKCLEKDTPILMFDGSIKMVQDVIIGDKVMGPDSKSRTVFCTNTDSEMMYKVKSKDDSRKINYGCNESHILTLKYCSDDYRYPRAKKGNIIDISVKEYLQLPNRHKRLLQGFTVGVEFAKRELIIPPYILGAWIGDGHSATTALTTMDSEIENTWKEYAQSIGMQVRTQENTQPNKSKVYFITSGEATGKSDRNPFMNELRSMELINNKHIPQWYKTSHSEDRLQLLAGLIDTDGTLVNETFIFTQKNNRVTEDVVFLAKSLGFRVTYKKRNSSYIKNGVTVECGEINVISIGGDTHRIPTKLARKQAKQKNKVRDSLNYGINVEAVGEGQYFGFTLLEEPHFVLGDFTVTHNTIAGRVQMAEQMLQMKLITDPNQYFQVINTGRLDSMFEGQMTELLLIKAENEKMLDGVNPLVSPTDKHSEHITEHKAILADPDMRNQSDLVKIVMDHLQDHINALRNTDPDLLKLCGETPLPPPQQQGGIPPNQPPQGQPQGPGPGAPQPPQGALQHSPMSGMVAAPQPPTQPGQAVAGGPGAENLGHMPSLPKVPASLLPNSQLQQAAMGNVALKK